ncbi:aminopeptidase P family protein [Halorubrum sp. BOL3-1]|uniref:aminopeptidase P family protein n=1 Tax=Halorubrum sp. BOL3-1 TaxID=2497325 RepID=UPI0010050A7E|nr:Xaa-Pro peptidase family protein [Halorubrum sp. BOL3-1]QAU13076.1 aminopeptidase P family protein [Halorubrum sp. BOL3-1]
MTDDAHADGAAAGDSAGPHERRRERTARRLAAIGAAGVVAFPSRNLQYLTGFGEEPGERHFFLVIPAASAADPGPALLVPALYETQVEEATSVGEVRTWSDGDDPVEATRELLADRGLDAGRLLVDDTMWARFSQDLRAAAPDAEWGLASEALADLRVRKDESELAALREAAEVADAVVGDLREPGADAVGTTETALAGRIADRLAERGGSGVSFETVVAAGENGAKPHHGSGDREIRAGEPVVLDFGTRVGGYPSDQTRTLVFGGEPPAEYREVHEVVREAQAAGVDAVGPDVPASAVDRAAREVIEAAGYGDAFVHRTGHGVGLDVHEEPYLVAGNDRRLEPGMVCSVEPGIYLDGRFGCRIEDLVVVTEDGCERLNRTDRGWETGVETDGSSPRET